MDLRLGADIDAARRLVQDQDRGLVISQRAISTFCWLPPREVVDGLVERRRLDRGACRGACAVLVESACVTKPTWRGSGRTAICMFSSTRVIRNSPLPCGPRSAAPCRGPSPSSASHRDRLAVDRGSSPAVAGVTPKMASATFGPARADQAGEAQDLARAQRRTRRLEDAVRAPGRAPTATTSPIGTRLREHVRDLAADHQRISLSRSKSADGVVADMLAVAEHRDLVGDLEDLVDLVRDVDDAYALSLFSSRDDFEQVRRPPCRSGPRSARP